MGLSGRRVLVLEDEYFIAQDLAEALTQEGATVVGPFARVDTAKVAIQDSGPPDLGVLDINLSGEMAFEIAAMLRDRQIPFVFATGYEPIVVPAAFMDVPLWRKPFAAGSLVGALGDMAGTIPD